MNMTKKRCNMLMAVGFLTIVLLMAALNLPKYAAYQFLTGELTFTQLTSMVHQGYQSDSLKLKDRFVQLNGGFCRITGRRICNKVMLLNNGLQCYIEDMPSVDGVADCISDFSDLAHSRGSELLYVQLPFKIDVEGSSLPPGVSYNPNLSADRVIAELEDDGTAVLELRGYLSATPEMTAQYFYTTDHHWTYEGAFLAFQQIMEYLAEKYPDAGIDPSVCRWEQWESHTIENYYLGSSGRRVGSWFSAPDDFTYYTPRFETDISFQSPRAERSGDFLTALFEQEYLAPVNTYSTEAYCACTGSDTSLIKLRNEGAASEMKLLLIKDSFSLPLIGYFSTAFKEIDVIDPRYFCESTIAEYAASTAPDMIMLCYNPRALYEPCFCSFTG